MMPHIRLRPMDSRTAPEVMQSKRLSLAVASMAEEAYLFPYRVLYRAMYSLTPMEQRSTTKAATVKTGAGARETRLSTELLISSNPISRIRKAMTSAERYSARPCP